MAKNQTFTALVQHFAYLAWRDNKTMKKESQMKDLTEISINIEGSVGGSFPKLNVECGTPNVIWISQKAKNICVNREQALEIIEALEIITKGQ